MSRHQAGMDILRHNQDLPAAYQRELNQEFDAVYQDHKTQPRILILGGAGYIGSVLTGYLLDCGYCVRCLDLFLYGQEEVTKPFEKFPSFELIKGDFTDENTLIRALDSVTDVVILAGLVGDPITKKYPEASQAINVDGMMQLIRILKPRELNKIIFVSTCSNYGLIPGDALADEQFELKPLSLYAKAKVAVEQELLALKGKLSFSPTVLRFATAFGLSPRMRFDLTVNEFTREAFLAHELLVYDAETWRPYCHVRDLSLVIRRVLEAPRARVAFEVFNVGGEANNMTKQMIVDAIKREVPALKVKWKEHGSDPRNYRVDFKKIKERLFFEPQYQVSSGIAELLTAFRQGQFCDVESRTAFYGNYTVDYPILRKDSKGALPVCRS
ncbi:MAG: NAD(P)-dependent oxidoreductase [Candidatus Omnitrophota bacterium]